MKPLIIFKTGSTFPDYASAAGDYDHWIRSGMGEIGLPVETINPRKQTALPAPSEISGVVITGSHAMVTDRATWSEALAAWLREAVAQQLPVLGICYGHQLLAHAMEGQVDYHPEGMEIGTVTVRRTEQARQDPLFGDLPDEFPAQEVHSQSVRRLPPGAVLLAGNGFDPHQAFRIGPSAWGVQFHPEFSPDAMAAYVTRLADDLQAKGRDAKELLSQIGATDSAASLLARFGRLVSRRQAIAD